MSALNLDELWIGERIKLIKNGQKGRFEGITADGKARISIDGHFMVTDAHNLELEKEDSDENPIDLWLNQSHVPKAKPTPVKLFTKEVDLHFDETASRAITSDQVLDWQLKRCRKHIETAIEKKWPISLSFMAKVKECFETWFIRCWIVTQKCSGKC